jgi:hypothetical protein
LSAHAEAGGRTESRAWWLRALLVAQAPRSVFAALRDDSREAAEDRQEPVATIAFLAALALTLVSSASSSFADDPARAGIVIPVWLFIAAALVAIVNFWVGGGVLYLALELLGGGQVSYRQARHLLTFAAVPLALGLVLVPVRLALYGSGSGAHVFTVLAAGFGLWAVVLLTLGIRTVTGWAWPRALGAVAVFGLLLGFADLALSVFG